MKFINSLLRKAYSKPPYNILSYSTHESYWTNLAKTGHNFYLLEGGELNTWKTKYRQVPENISIFNVNEEFPLDIDFDFILSQQKFGQIQRSLRLAEILHLPIINIEHTLPMPNWPKDYVQNLKNLKGDVNLFISEFSRKAWGWDSHEAGVIHHGIDTDIFCPDGSIPKKKHILAIVNDWINRDWACNFQGWQRITRDLPVKVLGDTPGLSLPAKDINELVRSYREAQVFINTATVSPIPTVMLEAMACLPPGEVVFLDTFPIHIEELVKYQTFNQTTLNNPIIKKHIISNYNGDLISIKCNHIPVFKTTQDHKIAIATFDKKYNPLLRKQHKKPYDTIIQNIEYKSAEELKVNDWVVLPKPQFETKSLNIDKNWLRFYGLYLAEGSASGGYINFTFHEKELDFINDVKNIAVSLGKIANIRPVHGEKAIHISFYDGYLCKKLLNMFGHESHNKQIPSEFFHATKQEIETFIHAYLDGDGYKAKNGYYTYSTVSKTLAYQLFLLFMKLGVLPSWNYIGPRKAIIKGREFNCRGKYQFNVAQKHEKSKKLYIENDDNFFVRITELTKISYVGDVYNLTTQSHTYNTPFALTHNCGNAVVTIDACMCPEIIQHNVNGLISKDENELRKYCQILLDHPETCKRLGEAARQTILEKFSLDNFITSWNKVFDYASELTYGLN